MQTVTTTHLENLWARTRQDHLRMRLTLLANPTHADAVFVLAVTTKKQERALIEIKTKNIDSAAARILDEYHTLQP